MIFHRQIRTNRQLNMARKMYKMHMLLRKVINSKRIFPKMRDESGVTTIGMAVAIFLSLTLIFSGAQLYRVGSASAEIQEVADACALAADNEVAEFVCTVNTCDAIILSFTLLTGTLYALGVVCACVPPLEALSIKLIDAADKTSDMRDSFYDKVVIGLNQLQKVLPFLAAANAASLAKANNSGALEANYFAVAALVPPKGVDFAELSDDGLSTLGEQVSANVDDVREKALEAEELSRKANEAKELAFKYDCGNAPSNCMYERAEKLSSISTSDNPLYTNVDSWSFEVPLKRAKAYYANRAKDPIETWGSIESRADSALRKRFYQYAVNEMSKAYVVDDGDHFSAYFPHLFRNTTEMKETSLYTEAAYPVTQKDPVKTMHAWSGCPNASGYAYLGSISELDAGGFTKCAKCEFVVSSLGKVAAASTSISNGFEYHYEHMRLAAIDYQSARDQLDPLNAAVKSIVEPILDSIGEIFKDAAAKRLTADPPGKYGVISMVVNNKKANADTGFESSFVSSGQTLGSTAAVSGANLLADSTAQGSSVITRIISGLKINADGFGAFDVVATCWTALLKVYEDGQGALNDCIESAFNMFSTNSSSGLGKWARGCFTDIVSDVGLQPADIKSYLPVLVNSSHVASKGEDVFSVQFSALQTSALNSSTSATTFSGYIAAMIKQNLGLVASDETVTIATIDLPISDSTQKVQWVLPDSIKNAGAGFVDSCIDGIAGSIGSIVGEKSWQ